MNGSDLPAETGTLVIGGGPGGYTAAIRAAQLGVDTTLVETDAYGGACLNRGCIPSKALLSGTGLAHEAGSAAEMGVHADPEIDAAAMNDWKDGVVDRLTRGVEKLCKGNGVALIEGRAALADEHEATVYGADGSEGTMGFDHAIVATGSRPIEVPGFPFEADPVLDSAAALDVEDPPDSLVIVGAGYVGMELATVFARMGSAVTILEVLDAALPAYDADLTRPVRRHLEELGVTFRFGEAASGYEDREDGITVVTEDGEEGGDTNEYAADRVLVAVGREPVTNTLNLDGLGLEPTDAGFLDTDEQARTAMEHVFAVGDVAGEPMLAHKASAEGEVAAEVIAGEDVSLDDRAIPAAVFTSPEIGTVGLTESEAGEAGYDPVVGEVRLRTNGRALTRREADGFVRIVGDAASGAILGGQIVGPEASELIAEIGLAIDTDTTLADVAGTVHTHPTLSESVMEAAKNALGRAIHALNR
jgi:dihydrolipoamide dehydrogenase